MGALCNGPDVNGLTKMINEEIEGDKKKITQIKKILFLGSGGSGKSTIFKQLRLIHGDGFTDNDKLEFMDHIHSQIINEMKLALRVYIEYNQRREQREKKSNDVHDNTDELAIWDGIDLTAQDLSNPDSAQIVLQYEYDKNKHKLEPEVCSAIKSLWNEPVIQQIYKLRNITKIETSSAYFWDKLDEIQDSNYLPSNEDIFLCRKKTTGLHEQQFETKSAVIHIIDVGGQQSQRRKWIHCFEYVVAVIFIASLSCYDEILEEDVVQNTMSDQLDLFNKICNNKSLQTVSMILFLNKTDLFEDKYCNSKIPLNKCDKFAEHNDESWDFERATVYIINEFERLDDSQNKKIFTHLTCATDTNNVEKVFSDVQDIVTANSLAEAGLIDQ